MSPASWRKGKEGELELVKFLRAIFPEVRRRPLGDETTHDQGRDLVNTPGFCVQVQRAAQVRPLQKLDEARSAARAGEIPVSIVRSDRSPWVVTLTLGDFIALVADSRGDSGA